MSGILAPYQTRWLEDPSPNKAMVKSRRIGGTFVVALEEAMRACGVYRGASGLEFDASRGVRQNIVSASEQQAIEHLAQCRAHLSHITTFDGAPQVVRETALLIELSNGVELRAYAANPRTIRGGFGDLTLDEFGAMPRAEEIWGAARPLANKTLGHPDGFTVRCIGTPLGDDNKFARIMNTDEGGAFSRHSISIYDAVKEGFPADIDAIRQEAGDEDMFAQEYCCSFLSSSARYISAELYDRAVYRQGECPRDLEQDGYAGYDVARKANGDLAVCVEVERFGDTLWVVGLDARRGVAWDDQEALVAQVLGRRRRIAVDATGIGQQFGERLQRQHHDSRVEAVTFTSKSKELLATGLKLALERGRLRVPDDVDLRRDVLSLRREVTAMGNTRFDADRNEHGHADRAWALALAVYASGSASAPVRTSDFEGLVASPGMFGGKMFRPGGRVF